MRASFIAAILAVLALSAGSVDCPVDQHNLLVSDSVTLASQQNSNTNEQNLVFNYQYQQQFQSTPSVAIGLSEIQANESPYLEIQVSASQITESGIYFQAKSGELSQWTNFQINFLASAREDLEIGTAVVLSPVTTREGTFELAYNINQDFSRTGLKIKSFLQGMSVQSANQQQIGIKQESAVVMSQRIYFTFSTLERASIIHSLTISIIIFNIYTPGVLYADGIIDQNFVVSKTEITIPKHGINELRTYIVGINSFETSAAQPISIYAAIDETFRLVIGPIDRNEIDYISVSYLILSIVDCGSCAGYPLLFDGLCKSSCPENYREDNGRCIPIDPTDPDAGCPIGFVRNEFGECIPDCGENAVYRYGTCTCKDGYYPINGVCATCPEDRYYDYYLRTCEPLCGGNSYYSNGRCFCLEGYVIIGGKCNKCAYGSRYDPTIQKCVDICTGRYQVYSPDGCVCKNGYHLINGVCGRCPYRQMYDPVSQSCVCMPGEEFVGTQCKPKCGINEIRRPDGYCDCITDTYRLVDGFCQHCPLNSYYDRIRALCVCRNPYVLTNGTCTPQCPPNYYFNVTTKTCEARCAQYLEEYVNGKCQCLTGYQRMPNNTCVAVCLQFQVRVNGRCQCIPGYTFNALRQCVAIRCPPGTYWNETRKDCISNCGANKIWINGSCVCRVGFRDDNVHGDCIPECSQLQIRVNGFCKCPDYHTRAGLGICIPECPGGTIMHNGRCTCKNSCEGGEANLYCPYGQSYDPVIGKCRCRSPSVWILGQCKIPDPCGTNEYWCGTACICNYGFYRVNGVCVPIRPTLTCPPNSVSNGVNCQCLDGFFPVTPGRCQTCPVNTYWNGQICAPGTGPCLPGYRYDVTLGFCVLIIPLCNPGEYWDGITCRCVQGRFWINGACRQCPYGTFFDGISCVTGIGIQCNDPFSFWNGERCVCIPGYWPLVDGLCITCPAGTYWDGTCCKTELGVQIPLTVI